MSEKPVEYQYGPRSVAIGDFNNDTILDMIVAHQKVNKITLYFGVGDGTFINRSEYSTGIYSSPYMVECGDFNNDSQLDIAVVNFDSNKVNP